MSVKVDEGHGSRSVELRLQITVLPQCQVSRLRVGGVLLLHARSCRCLWAFVHVWWCACIRLQKAGGQPS
jgi:hypothetical protein